MSSDLDSAMTDLTPQTGGGTFKLPLGPPKPKPESDVVMSDATPNSQTDSEASVLPNIAPEVEVEVPPSQIVWSLDEEEQPIDQTKPPKTKKKGSIRPPKRKIKYFWKLLAQAKIPDPKKWVPLEYALFYVPATKADRISVDPSLDRGSRSRSPKKFHDETDEDRRRRLLARSRSRSRGSSHGSSRGRGRSQGSRDSSPPTGRRSKKQSEPVQAKDEAEEVESTESPSTQDCIFIEWSRFERYRDSGDSMPLIKFSKMNFIKNIIEGIGYNGQQTNSRPLTPENGIENDDWPNLHKFFKRTFDVSQIKSKIMDMSSFPYWRRPLSQNDGEIRFLTSNPGGGTEPRIDVKYVRMATAEGNALVTKDIGARRREVNANGIYIDRATMDQLSSGTYEWLQNCFTIPIREESGRINYLTCSKDFQSSIWWEKAYTRGVAKQEGKSVRSRNVKNLELLFIVCKSEYVTKEIIIELINSAKTNAAITIQQTVQVLGWDEKEKIEEMTGKGKFSRLLSLSPFGDYQTWIQEKDFISYLQSYPGYALPRTSDLIAEAFGALEPERKAKKNNADFAKALKAQDEIAKRNPKYPKDVPGAVVGLVSSETVGVAGVRNARKQVPDQGTQMGGSATTIAKAATWPDAGERIGSKEDRLNGITWDNPGVYPSEWLHRIAFSWGNPGGNKYTAANTNFIFGSSEANSIMTRFEKSWQRLFSKERSYQLAVKGNSPDKFKMPPFEGLLMTVNTKPDNPITEFTVKDGEVKTTTWNRSDKGVVTKSDGSKDETVEGSKDEATGGSKDEAMDGSKDEARDTSKDEARDTSKDVMSDVEQLPDYWSWTTGDMKNLSFSLFYRLLICHKSSIRETGLLSTTFFPFQRGFFTRIEADLDFLLLDRWAEDAKKKIAPPIQTGSVEGYTLPHLQAPGQQTGQTALGQQTSQTAPGQQTSQTAPGQQTSQTQPLALNQTTQQLGLGGTFGSPLIVSSSAPGDLPQAEVWRAAVNGQSIQVGGVQLSGLSVVTTSSDGHQTKVPLDTNAMASAVSSGKIEVLVSDKPLTSTTPPVEGAQAATDVKTISAPAELQVTDDPSGIPGRFVLSGNVKLFGMFDEQLYSYYGEPSVGLRQIVQIKSGTAKISDYIPHLAGSELDAVQFNNTQFIYNQFTTATDQAGTWLQTDLYLSGPLQPVNKVLKNVFKQDKPLIRVEAFVSPRNDWSKPVAPASFGLRGSIPGMQAKFADLVEFTDLGLSVSVGRYQQPWPPYTEKIDWGVVFSGSLNIETPNDIAPLQMDYSLSEYAGVMNLMITLQDTSPNFFGITGLAVSNVMFSTTFGIDDDTTALSLVACASLELRDTSIDLGGHYTKGDWAFFCDLEEFDFASFRDMYEDLFGSPLHLSDHEIELDDLDFVASSNGILVSGSVTIEEYSCAEASISISSLGVEIKGEVDDIHLAKDIVLQQAALDIFIGPTQDTTVSGPGTSFRFAINGTVSFGGNDVSATLFIGKDASNGLIWTVYGAFQGAVSLNKLAPSLKGSFLDLPLQQACLIASNVDGNSAAGSVIPANFPIIKGVQIAATVGSIAALDHSMHNQGAATSGLMLQAVYNEDTSAFDLDITLAAPQTVAMKNKSIWSGPISLVIDVSANPSLMILADFFVLVPNQDSPLKFTGGIRANVEEAKAFIELKGQWWNNPFGLSRQLKLGPDLALQLGIVYAGPLYPSEVGIAAGLMIGDVSGQAALSISEAPNDELIMIQVDNLGIKDLVSFASTIFELDLPKPDDFLHFKLLTLYMSTGTTIGTTYYPPGASFSCDAIVFGKEASIYCSVDKTNRAISVKGSLDPIDIGPVSITGSKPGTKSEVAVTLGATTQSVLIDGGIRIADLDAEVHLNATFLPNIFFELESELDFSTHLKFVLNATMRNGSFTSMSGLHSLDFDIYVLFQQDILNYMVAQVNMQILAAKKAVDDGIEGAQATLNNAQKIFDDKINLAQDQVNNAKSKYDLKVAQVQGAFQAEKTKSDLKMKQLQAEVDRTFQAFSGAVAKTENDLRIANENRTNEIRKAQQDVTNAKNASDGKINEALSNLNNARNDMQKRFGNALNQLKSAEHDVENAHGVVDKAHHEVDNAKHDLAHCHWYEKVPKAAVVAAMGTKLTGAEAGLAIASKALDAAKAIVSGPGYAAANASVNFYQSDLDDARKAADAALSAANGALQTTTSVQNDLVSRAETALRTVQTVGQELQDSNLTKKALADFQKAEDVVLTALAAGVTGLMNCSEKVAFDAATAGLAIARANTNDLDVARSALAFAEHSTDDVMDVGAWVIKNTVNILNLTKVELKGDLRGLCQQGTSLQAHIVGTFADQAVDFEVEYMPGQGEEMVKELFRRLMGNIKTGALSVAKAL